jgi:mono/diheme cytochrome c family protein
VGPALGPGSNAATQADEFIVLTVTRGRGRMPSFGSTLTSEQIDRVVAFLREQQG